MALEQDIANLTQAANELTTVVDNQVQSIDQRVDNFIDKWGIDGYTEINVGPNRAHKDIGSAWNSLTGKKLAADVRIKVDDGTYQTTGIALYHHPDAHRIKIEGNIHHPENCVLQMVPDAKGYSHGVLFNNVRYIEFSGFKIVGHGNKTYRGIHIDNLSYVRSSDNSIIIENCYYGIEVYSGSKYFGRSPNISNCDTGIRIGSGAEAHVHHAKITGRGKKLGFGICVQDNAKCWAGEADVSQFIHGFYSARGAYINCQSAKAESCHHGFISSWSSTIWCNPNAHNKKRQAGEALHCHVGFCALNNGTIFAHKAKVQHCSIGYLAHSMSHIDAYDTSAKLAHNTTNYSPPRHAVLGNDNAMIRRS